MTNVVANRFKSLSKRAVSRCTQPVIEHIALQREAIDVRQKCLNCRSIEELVDLLLQCKSFRAYQKRREIIELLKIVNELQPRRLCEIGSDRGGTLALFCHAAAPDAKVLSIDLAYTHTRQVAHSLLALPGQHVTCMRADTHSPATLKKVTRWLSNHPLDFLFIDGDHSLAGVTADFKMYAPLVRSGGIVGFHDIVPDYRTRFGTPTPSDVGEVPAFWEHVKQQYASTDELVEDPDQDGFGIGVLPWTER